MSNSCLIHWFEKLLFGDQVPSTPPLQLKNIILRMEAENIPWSHIILQGGLTALHYQVHGDLNILLAHLENFWLEFQPQLKTREVTKFWYELKRLLAKREEIRQPALPSPSTEDGLILQELLDSHHQTDSYAFQSAQFWGEVARRFINLRRPEKVAALCPVSSRNEQRIIQLYTIACVARGQWFDPLTMHLVHHSEYLNAVHWQSPRNLEAFMHDRPTHLLTRSVQALLKRTVDQLLQGETMTAFLNPCSRHNALLHNIRVIHESVQQVPHEETPPRLIDVFQRLLALCFKDQLWEEDVPPLANKPDPFIGTSLLHLTEQLRIVEREKRLLWNHVIERNQEYVPRQPLHTCPVCARNTENCDEERGCQTFPG